MKQAVERIGRIREAALRHLRALLGAPARGGGEDRRGVAEWIAAVAELDACVPSQVGVGSLFAHMSGVIARVD